MHEKYMKQAIKAALKGKGKVGLNPMVGAVIVKDGRTISIGYHKAYGQAHAEEDAINKATEDLKGASIYVTLEPCSHYGKRPPCSKLLVDKGFARVIIGCLDPNPRVAGNGVKELEEAGIEVIMSVLEAECRKLNEVFFHHIVHKKPYVLMKSAMTLDGKIASYTGDSKWISGEKSRTYVHQLRAELDGIMVGINTVLTDNPSLNVRMVKGRDPVRIVVDSRLDIGMDAKLLHLESKSRTIIATTKYADKEKLVKLSKMANVQVLMCNDLDGHIDLNNLMERLYQEGIGSILLEGGAGLNYHMLRAGLVNKLNLFIAPKIIGGTSALGPVAGQGISFIKDAIDFEIISYKMIDEDLLLEARACLQGL